MKDTWIEFVFHEKLLSQERFQDISKLGIYLEPINQWNLIFNVCERQDKDHLSYCKHHLFHIPVASSVGAVETRFLSFLYIEISGIPRSMRES